MLTAALPTAINKIHLIPFTVDWEYRVAEKAAFISLSIYFLQLYCSMGSCPTGNSVRSPRGKANCDRVPLPNLGCVLGVLVFR